MLTSNLRQWQEVVYDFWDAAQVDILSDWMRETDPTNLQPKVRPLNLRVAEFIRHNPAVGLPEDEVISNSRRVGENRHVDTVPARAD